MAGYQPVKITGNSTGLVQEREEFLLPNDAYPTLQNAYVWREAILRKKGYQLLGRLQRNFSDLNYFPNAASPYSFNILNVVGYIVAANNLDPGKITTSAPHNLSDGDQVVISDIVGATGYNNVVFTITKVDSLNFTIGMDAGGYGTYISGGIFVSNRPLTAIEPFSSIVPGSVTYTIFANTTRVFVDDGMGHLLLSGTQFGTINYATGVITITTSAGFPRSTSLTYSYYPALPVMGIRIRELQNSANDQTVFFDQRYAYIFNSGLNQFQEFILGTTWNNHNGSVAAVDFFWSTNYWISNPVIPGTSTPFFTTLNFKLFWVTNNTGAFGSVSDPPMITDGTTWVPWWTMPGGVFTPQPWIQIDATTYLVNWLANLPFRGRMVTFNTWEGVSPSSALNYPNRIRWATIGNPFIPYAAGPPATGSWRDDIRGQGGFLDIPTSEDIVSVGFVRDNLVIYCERSTWQLRYTGRAIAPFQIEKVNSEIGAESLFSGVQFDTSLVGIGDKGIVECDSYKSKRIDIKIPDFVFQFNSLNNATVRVQGVRDFPNRLAYWTIPLAQVYEARLGTNNWIYPNIRLVYNYENDSWALFNDSLTALGTYQAQSSRTWLNTQVPWIRCNFPWINQPSAFPSIVGGNQQGFVEFLDELTTNDSSLFIEDITANTTSPTEVTSPNHNMSTGFVIGIEGIPSGSPFANLNGGVFSIIVQTANTFLLILYDPTSMQFSTPQLDIPSGSYIGGGLINIRENFNIKSKKFNFLDEGQNIQMGYLDILMDSSEPDNPGAISLNVYLDYNDSTVSNILPQNQINDGNNPVTPDNFFNSTIPTTTSSLNMVGGTKFWQRIYCPTRSNFITLQYTLSNAQMAGIEQEQDLRIDAQILWMRKAGRMTQI